MNTSKNFPKPIQSLKDSQKNQNEEYQMRNQLISPRFEIATFNNLSGTKLQNSLLFLMYSHDNETLII